MTRTRMMDVRLWIRTWTGAWAMEANLFFEKLFFFELWIFHLWWKFFDRFSPFFLDRNFTRFSSWIFREDFDFSLLWSSFIVRECSCDAIQSEFKFSDSLTPPFSLSLFLDPLSFTRIWRKRLYFFCLFLSLLWFAVRLSEVCFRNFGNS